MTQLEYLIANDVLLMLAGIEGDYFKMNRSQNGFTVAPSANISGNSTMLSFLDKFSQIGNEFRVIQCYIQRAQEDFDSVAKEKAGGKSLTKKAFVSAVEKLMEDYLVFVGGQLEVKINSLESHDNLLVNLFNLLQSTGKKVSFLHSLVANVQKGLIDADAAKLLNFLNDQMKACIGLKDQQNIVRFLLNETSKPLMKMCYEWIQFGELRDDYDEFFILKRKLNVNSNVAAAQKSFLVEYWYTNGLVLRSEESVPAFLTDIVKEILLTGKYYNILRIYHMDTLFDFHSTGSVTFSYNTLPEFQKILQEKYSSASNMVLKVLFTENDLFYKLKTIKHYFFCSQSDYLVNFLDQAGDLLRQSVNTIDVEKLQILFENCLKNSSSVIANGAGFNFYVEDMFSVQLSKYSLVDMLFKIITMSNNSSDSLLEAMEAVDEAEDSLTGLNAFCLEVELEFPLCLVVSKKCMMKYQLIFRQLFTLKYVEHLLSLAWTEHQAGYRKLVQGKANDNKTKELLKTMKKAWLLRCRMTTILQGLHAFITDRLEVGWIELEKTLFEYRREFGPLSYKKDDFIKSTVNSSDKSLDKLLLVHDQFLDDCLKECLITNKKLAGKSIIISSSNN